MGDRERVPAESAANSAVVLPPTYKFAVAVPKGGASCATCFYLTQAGDCGNKHYVAANGGLSTLGKKPSRFCCSAWSREDRG